MVYLTVFNCHRRHQSQQCWSENPNSHYVFSAKLLGKQSTWNVGHDVSQKEWWKNQALLLLRPVEFHAIFLLKSLRNKEWMQVVTLNMMCSSNFTNRFIWDDQISRLSIGHPVRGRTINFHRGFVFLALIRRVHHAGNGHWEDTPLGNANQSAQKQHQRYYMSLLDFVRCANWEFYFISTNFKTRFICYSLISIKFSCFSCSISRWN